MTATIVAGVIGGAAMAAGAWCFSEATQINKLFHRTHKRLTKLELAK